MDAFRAYFLSHAAFVVRAIPPGAPAETPGATGGNPSLDGGVAPRREEIVNLGCENGTVRGTDGSEEGESHEKGDAVPTGELLIYHQQPVRASPSLDRPVSSTDRPVTAAEADGETAATAAAASGDVRVWGAFYIKPNFPGRCSHVCNGGFITDTRRRRRGVARLMGQAFLRLAKDLGYKASYFNLVSRKCWH